MQGRINNTSNVDFCPESVLPPN
uniref:Uncharacterized protein n=1 Tax=Anguilla anguilla TaxID=7936 RepID=A0A0E9VS53_ANGAN